MALKFTDAAGDVGRITGDLTVVYDGELDVRGYVERIVADLPDGADVLDELAIRLPEELPIESVEYVGGADG